MTRVQISVPALMNKDKMLLDLPSSIQTERLALRCYKKGDGSHYYALLHQNKKHLRHHLDEIKTITNRKKAEIKVREYAADWTARTKFIFGIWKKTSSTLLGEIGLYPVKWDVPLFEMGWFLDKDHEGKGYASEAVGACLAFAFRSLRAHKVQVRVRETNKSSVKLALRCGFAKEGMLRDNARVGKKFVGLGCYGMLEEEYYSLNEKRK